MANETLDCGLEGWPDQDRAGGAALKLGLSLQEVLGQLRVEDPPNPHTPCPPTTYSANSTHTGVVGEYGHSVLVKGFCCSYHPFLWDQNLSSHPSEGHSGVSVPNTY